MAGLKAEVRGLLGDHKVGRMAMKPVQREYAFENGDVPHGKQWVLKVKYPGSQPALPVGLAGAAFSACFGGGQSALESLTLKRKIMGPGWLALRQPRRVEPGVQQSWCRLEVELDSPKAVGPATGNDANRCAPGIAIRACGELTAAGATAASQRCRLAQVSQLHWSNSCTPPAGAATCRRCRWRPST